MSAPKIIIFGRPNVGKSELFNAILKKNRAIVNNFRGVTRDAIYHNIIIDNKEFTLIDSAGMDSSLNENETDIAIQNQINSLVNSSDGIIFVVDSRIGLIEYEKDLLKIARNSNKPYVLAINKCDTVKMIENGYVDFLSLGVKREDTFCISAIERRNINNLISRLASKIIVSPKIEEDSSHKIKVAIVGKPNSGKSTLINRILKENISVVSSIPGTTRDSIDADFEYHDQVFTITDTAGIRKVRGIAKDSFIEFLGIEKAKSSVARSDVAVFVMDSTTGINTLDKKILSIVETYRKPAIIAINKWDEADDKDFHKCRKRIEENVRMMREYPKVFISGKTGMRVYSIFRKVIALVEKNKHRVSTSELNTFIRKLILTKRPPTVSGRRLIIYYMTQVATNPPIFLLFVNNSELIAPSFRKYIENQIVKEFDFHGIPITLKFRSKTNESTEQYQSK